MDAVDRVRLLKELERLENRDLTEITGSKKDYWKNTLQRKQRLYQDELEKLGQKFPEYAVWLGTGIEVVNEGHISPMTKRSHRVDE